MITLTRKNLHELSGSPGQAGFTAKQIQLLGFTWPPQKGWLSSLIGSQITEAKYEQVKAACRAKWKEPISRDPFSPQQRAEIERMIAEALTLRR